MNVHSMNTTSKVPFDSTNLSNSGKINTVLPKRNSGCNYGDVAPKQSKGVNNVTEKVTSYAKSFATPQLIW